MSAKKENPNSEKGSVTMLKLTEVSRSDPEVGSMSNGVGRSQNGNGGARSNNDGGGPSEINALLYDFRKWLPRWLRVAFPEPAVEDLYQLYYHKQKQRDMDWFCCAAILMGCCMILVHAWQPSWNFAAEIVLLGAATLLHGVILLLCKLGVVSQTLWHFLPYVSWTLVDLQLFADALLTPVYAPEPGNDALIWALAIVYITYALLPLRLRFCTLLGLLTSVAYVFVIALVSRQHIVVINEVGAGILLLIGANVLGVMSHIFTDIKQRTSFLETRQSLEVKLVIEEQSQEQERLLLSVLPQHVAAEIRDDLGAVVDGQFKKIYLSRHENVSILFADIVGFTAISSTYSAADLVQILNELFARFDKLAERFHQLRIKILGDCYYCISGAPVERPDHAVLCVHMGLSMVEAIKYVREKTKSPVDMRVGIHTGGILAGVMGQRQWQFDVYSKDVELANKMESSGLPGRVHISEKTLNYLKGEFEIETGDGASREESIKSACLKTYFIVKVIKPYPEGTLDVDLQGTDVDPLFDEHEEYNAKEDTKMLKENEAHSEENYRRRLHQELTKKGKQRSLSEKTNPLTLCFKDRSLEGEYNSQSRDQSGAAVLSAPIVLLDCALAQFCVLPRNLASILTFAGGCIITGFMATISLSPSYPEGFPALFVRVGESISKNFFLRHIWVSVIIVVLAFSSFIDEFFCEDDRLDDTMTIANVTLITCVADGCLNPQYFSIFITLVLLAIAVLLHISHIVKLLLMTSIVAVQCLLNFTVLQLSFTLSDKLVFLEDAVDMVPRNFILSAMVATIAIALACINRHTEVMARLLFLWKKEVEEQKELVTSFRQKNEALVYNILPPHVASHFLGQRKRDEELYSQSYSEVSVLFASMPNFSDFYTEESVNNQGLECLRFLNEVISDYDALLEEPRFKDIIKIKTIGSTYMAASGLSGDVKHDPNAPLKVRWAHLARLTEFALTLKDTLQGINEQSFNNFLLRMGINHGPIIAGVIGARKPHYDMWGNTVNVASRMESTGKAGCIQTVEETANILKEFGYEFEQRGLVSVKGKGRLMTYYLITNKNVS